MSVKPPSRLPLDIDIHAHSGPLRPGAVVCVDPVESMSLPPGDGLLSVGIHPWNAAKADDASWDRLRKWLDDARVVALGEIGMDRLRGPALEIQEDVFMRQAEAARERGLPVVIHCVRAFDILTAMRKKLLSRPTGEWDGPGQWVVHGFRGKPETARQLLNAGIDLSFGDKFNEESFRITPPDRRYRETDR